LPRRAVVAANRRWSPAGQRTYGDCS
jgi:hypothetical protein